MREQINHSKSFVVLLSGETVTFKSEFFDFKNVKVTPEPIQKPHPPIWLGGFTPAALRRAARYGDGFTVPGATRDVYDHYVAELKKQNRPTENIRFASAVWCLIVSKDPEKTFAEAADHIIYQANNYSAWLSAAGLSPLSEHLRDREQLRQSGLLQVVDPDSGDKHDSGLRQQRPHHPLLFVDATAWIAAAMGSSASRALRIRR